MGTHGAASVRARATTAGYERADSTDVDAVSRRIRKLSDWPVSRRLFTVIALALVMGLVFGGLRTADAESSAAQFGRTAQLAALSGQLTTLIDDLQNERDATMSLLQAGSVRFLPDGTTPRPLAGLYAKTNRDAAVVAQSTSVIVNGPFPANIQADAARVQGETGSGSIGGLHTIMGSPATDIEVAAQYGAVVSDMITLADQVAQGVSDAQLSNDVRALNALALAKEQASQQRGLLNFALAIPPGGMPADVSLDFQTETTLRVAYIGELADEAAFQAAATPAELAEFNATLGPGATRLASEHFTDAVENTIFDDASGNAGPPVVGQGGIVLLDVLNGQQQLGIPDTIMANGKPKAVAWTLPRARIEWNNGMTAKLGAMLTTERLVNGNILARAEQLQAGAKQSAVTTAIISLVVLLLVLLAALYVARSLVLPLRRLRASALNIASVQLPERVRQLSASPDEAAANLQVQPINVLSADEVGQVARAFDQVHAEAVRLAGEEAILRTSFNAMFVNLSRRSQSLIERLARMIDGLEQTEEDPERLSGLFSMDHLVTRMRRNSENLLLLAGHENPRKWSEPVALADVARAATSEIEQYNRVTLSISPGVAVIGQAVSDVVHLLAELIENATIFSPKDSPVQVTAQELSSGGVLIEITDKGIGVSEARLADMNWRLDNPPVMDVSVSRHMGLFAVARLAERHRVRVRLRQASPQGLTALVWLPESVIERTNRLTVGSLSTQPVGAGARRGQSPVGQRGSQDSVQGGGRRALSSGPQEQLREDGFAVDQNGGALSSRQSSGWFRGRSGTPADPVAGRHGAGGNGMSNDGYAAAGFGDGGWGDGRNPADVIADPAYGEQTTAGLPLRTPKANLIPGSPVGPGGLPTRGAGHPGGAAGGSGVLGGLGGPPVGQPPSMPQRSADRARSRLAGFQRGTRRAEEQAGQGSRAGEGSER